MLNGKRGRVHTNGTRRNQICSQIVSFEGVQMFINSRPGAVIFTRDHRRLAKFYEAVTDLPISYSDESISVLRSDTFELLIHAIPHEPPVDEPPSPREDCYIKPFFPVESLAEVRERAAAHGGRLRSAD